MDNKSEEKVPISRRPVASKKKRKHKAKDFPKRPLSAYNIFFKETREEMLEAKETEVDDGNVDFQSMVKTIAAKWKSLSPRGRERVEAIAKTDLKRYKDEVRTYERQMVERSHRERELLEQQNREDQEKAEAAAAFRKQLEDDKLLAEHMARRASHSRPAADEQFSILAQESVQSAAEHQLILEQELRNLDAARELKIRQLQLAQLQAGVGSGSSMVSSLHPPGAGGLSSGVSTADLRQELDMLRRQGAVPAGHALGGAAALGRDYGLPAGLVPRMSAYPPLHQVAYSGQDALLRDYALQQQEQDLMAAQLGGRSMMAAADHPTLAGYGAPSAALSSDYFRARGVAGHPGLSHGFPPSAYPRQEGYHGSMDQRPF